MNLQILHFSIRNFAADYIHRHQSCYDQGPSLDCDWCSTYQLTRLHLLSPSSLFLPGLCEFTFRFGLPCFLVLFIFLTFSLLLLVIKLFPFMRIVIGNSLLVFLFLLDVTRSIFPIFLLILLVRGLLNLSF